jgi:ribosomal protein L7/L12
VSAQGIVEIAILAVAAVFCLIGYVTVSEVASRTRRIERKLDRVLQLLGATDPANLRPVREALLQGRKIEAIKLYRQATGADLRTAKDAVDELSRTGEQPG